MKTRKRLLISIISHGQGDLVKELLNDLDRVDFSEFKFAKIIVTLNIPENDDFLNNHNLDMSVIRNINPKGFGRNHNCAFEKEENDIFVIINPDIRLKNFSLFDITANIDETIGAIAPKVINPQGRIEDSFRKYPSVFRILKRNIFHEKKPDYKIINNSKIDADWLAGMFVIYNSLYYKVIGGFDERYYMYLEDADLCRRLTKLGVKIILDPSQSVIHDARRGTFKNFQHFKWHLRSMIRFILNI